MSRILIIFEYLQYSRTDEFYERSFLYRYWYVTPTFAWFRMRIYIGLTLSECVCTMAGLGAYPKAFLSKSGNGPTKIDAIKQLYVKKIFFAMYYLYGHLVRCM